MQLANLRRLGDRQFGVVTRGQLHASMLSDKQIEHLVRTGQILRVHRAVYRLPASQTSTEQQALAACFALGDGAVASHATAARLWRIMEGSGGRPELGLPR